MLECVTNVISLPTERLLLFGVLLDLLTPLANAYSIQTSSHSRLLTRGRSSSKAHFAKGCEKHRSAGTSGKISWPTSLRTKNALNPYLWQPTKRYPFFLPSLTNPGRDAPQ